MNFSLPAILTFAALTGLASASVVNIDFNHLTSATYSGQAAASDLAGGGTAYWNPLLRTVAGTASSVALQDSTNTATGVGFTLSGLTGSSSTIGEQEVSVGGGFRSLMRDYVSIDAGSTPGAVVTATGKFTGLVVGASYELYFYGQGSILGTVSGVPLNQGQNSLFTVDGTSKQTEWDNVAGGNGSLAENIEYVKFLAVADINGEIDFSFANVVAGVNAPSDLAPNSDPSGSQSSRFGALNAIQLVKVVPEPSTALLSALGVLGLVARRRRR